MQYLLTQEELDNLNGNKELLTKVYNKKLDEYTNKFAEELSRILVQRKVFPTDLYRNHEAAAILDSINIAMKNCKIPITEPEKPSSH